MKYFKYFLTFSAAFVFVFLSATYGFKANTVSNASESELVAPKIVNQKNRVGAVALGRDATSALKAFDPTFKLYEPKDYLPAVDDLFKEDSENQTPMAIVADFNCDSVNDIVVMGKTRTREQVVVALLSQKQGFKAQEIKIDYVASSKLVYPPMVNDEEESDEHEYEIGRQQGLMTYLSLLESAEHYKGEPDGARRYRCDALNIEVYNTPDIKIFHAESGEFVRQILRSRRR